jgi:arylsulfatase A-like enzyme
MYPPDALSLPKNFMPQPPFDTGTLEIRDELLLPRPLDPEAIKRETGRYYAMITHLDAQIGRILARLEETGQLDNTLIIFAGDNGLTLGAHGLLGKQTLYDEGVRVPMIIRGPGVQRGGTCNALVDLMDIMPTLCEVAGVAPEGTDGQSLLPLARGEAAPKRDAIFLHYDDVFRAVRNDKFKYIAHLKTGREELFNLQDDPFELHDLAGDAAFSVTKIELRDKLNAWRQSVGDDGARI